MKRIYALYRLETLLNDYGTLLLPVLNQDLNIPVYFD